MDRNLPTGRVMPAPAIAVLWKSGDGRLCVVSRRGTRLVLTVERDGVVEREQVIESPREALDVAAKWRLLLKELRGPNP